MRLTFALLITCFSCFSASAAVDETRQAVGFEVGFDRPALDLLKNFGKGSKLGLSSREFLEPDKAFVLSVDVKDASTLIARWGITDGYYLYRDKFTFKLDHPGVRLGQITVPPGEFKQDPTFGRVEINTGHVEVKVPLIRGDPGAMPVNLLVGYQGCAEAGICYPLIEKRVPVELVAFKPEAFPSGDVPSGTAEEQLSAEQALVKRLASGAVLLTLLSFLGFGVLLSFTPCIFPTVPILSGIIVGQGQGLTTRRAFVLSLVFVLAIAVTYAAIGLIAALFGQNLQAMFQNKWVLVSFAGVFVILALSMFGFFKIQLPASWQSTLASASNRQKRGALHGVAAMGLFSAIIVGPCVAPPLAGALIYIGQTGDALLGGLALFAMGLGMGLPLLAIGTSMGKLLPKAGAWMQAIQRVFGVVLLGVAIWLLERVLPGPVILLLWGLLLIISSIYMGAMDALDALASGWQRLSKGLGLAMLIYGALLIVGAAGGGTDVFRPLTNMGVMAKGINRAPQQIEFISVKGVARLERAFAKVRTQGKPVMLDLYADWCVECQQMEKHTFSDSKVRQALVNTVLLKADVTANDEEDRELLRTLGLYGPPAILFYGPDGVELRSHRLLGFVGPEEFRKHVEAVLRF